MAVVHRLPDPLRPDHGEVTVTASDISRYKQYIKSNTRNTQYRMYVGQFKEYTE